MNQPASILVVDDEAPIRLTLDALLRRCGYSVTVASSGEQALAYAASHPIDLVLVDLILSGMSGLEVAERVHALQPNTSILILTGSDLLGSAEYSGYIYMRKTASPQAVLAQIAALIEANTPLAVPEDGTVVVSGAPLLR